MLTKHLYPYHCPAWKVLKTLVYFLLEALLQHPGNSFCFIVLCARELIFSQRVYSTFRLLKSIESITGEPLQNWNQSIDTLSLYVSKIMDFRSEIPAALLNNWMTLDKRFHLAKSHFAHLYTEIIRLALQSNQSKNTDVWKAPSSEPGILPALNKELFSSTSSCAF